MEGTKLLNVEAFSVLFCCIWYFVQLIQGSNQEKTKLTSINVRSGKSQNKTSV